MLSSIWYWLHFGEAYYLIRIVIELLKLWNGTRKGKPGRRAASRARRKGTGRSKYRR